VAVAATAQSVNFFFEDLGQCTAGLLAEVVSECFPAFEELRLFFGSFVSIFVHWWFPWFMFSLYRQAFRLGGRETTSKF
jgi:hypothetical protein